MPAALAQGDVEGSLRTARIIGIALVASLLHLAALVEAIARGLLPVGGGGVLGEAESLLRYLFFALAIGAFGLTPFVRRAILGQAKPVGPRLLAASTVSLALAEAIAVYGFVLFLLTRRLADFYPFLGLSLIAFAVHFPRRERWEDRARQRP